LHHPARGAGRLRARAGGALAPDRRCRTPPHRRRRTRRVDVAGGNAQRDARLSLSLRRGSGISTGDAVSRLSTRLNATQRIGGRLEVTGHASYVGDHTEDSKLGAVIDGQTSQSVGAAPVDTFARWASTQLGSAMGGRLDHLTTGVDVAIRPMQRLTVRAALSRDRVDEGAGYQGPPFELPGSLAGYYLGDATVSGPYERAAGRSMNREVRLTGEYSRPLSVAPGAELLLVAGSEREHRTGYEGQSRGVAGAFASTEVWRGLVDDAQFALARLQGLDRFAASVGLRRERDGGVAGDEYRVHPMAEVAVRPMGRVLRGDLRLRAAYGESTQRLATFGMIADFPTYPPYGYPYGGYSFGFGAAPAEPIGPETMQETEGGFDLGWGPRGAISFSAYHRSLKNVLAKSQAFVAQTLTMSSSGVEADARATVMERGSMRWSLRALVATNRNRITSPDISGYPYDPGLLSDQPVGAAKRRPYTFADVNADGIAEGNEVNIDNAYDNWGGGSAPTLSMALHSELALGRRFTLGVIVDRRSGAWTQSSVANSVCAWPEYSCREMQDPTTPVDVQAAAIANRYVIPLGSTFDASFTRLREVSARWTLPVGRMAALGASGAHVMVAGRDLATWTKWPGTDPEISSLPRSALTRDDGSAVPLPRRLIVGLEFDY
jgi:hypothetical protein